MAEAKKVAEPEVVSGGKNDVQENKIYGILAYIGILFIVPLLAAPKSPFAKFHANQGCILFIASVALSLVAWIPILGWIVGFAGWVFLLVLAIMGIVNAANGEMKKLPLLGDFEIIK